MINTPRLCTFSNLLEEIERRHGLRLHISTLHRWRTRGVRGKRLKATRIGGRWLSSLADLHEFMQSEDSPPRRAPPPVRAAAAQLELQQRYGM